MIGISQSDQILHNFKSLSSKTATYLAENGRLVGIFTAPKKLKCSMKKLFLTLVISEYAFSSDAPIKPFLGTVHDIQVEVCHLQLKTLNR